MWQTAEGLLFFYPYAEQQSVYSTVPDDWARFAQGAIPEHIHQGCEHITEGGRAGMGGARWL